MYRQPAILVVVPLLALAALSFANPVPSREQPVISVANAALVRKLTEVPRDVYGMVWGPKRRQLSLVSWEKPVEVVDSLTFEPLRPLFPGRRPIHMAVSGDGQTVAFCENTTSVEIQSPRTGKTVVLETKNHQPAMAFSPDGRLLATGGYGTQAKLWEAASGRFVRSLDTDAAGGLTVVFSPDGKTLALGNRNSTTRLFDVATGKLLHVLPQKMSQELKFSTNGRTLAVAYVNGSVSLWSVADGTLVQTRETPAKELYTLDWSPAGDVLATAGLEGKITLWDPRDLSVLKELHAPEWLIRVRFTPDGTRLLSAGGIAAPPRDIKVTVWGVSRR
jgi:WD40 repeat protein